MIKDKCVPANYPVVHRSRYLRDCHKQIAEQKSMVGDFYYDSIEFVSCVESLIRRDQINSHLLPKASPQILMSC